MPTIQVTPTEEVLLQGVADALFKARKVVVITGAGISTNSGIPDFRSENGLYSLIQAQFDAASRDTVTGPTGLPSADAIHEEREPPTKRRKLSFQDSGICIPSEEPQTINGLETANSNDHKTPLSEEETPRPARPNPPRTKLGSVRSPLVDEETQQDPQGRPGTPSRSERSLRRSRRAQSLPPEESPRRNSPGPRLEPSTEAHHAELRDVTTRNFLFRRGRSASPDPRRRTNTYQSHSAELRKRSLLTSSFASMQASESADIFNFASSPLRPSQLQFKSSEGPEETLPVTSLPSKSTVRSACHITTPKTSRFYFSSSPLSSPPSVLPQTPVTLGSSPLSSPPPVLFDPFGEPSSSTSQQSSSVASSAASSETDETPPSSNPSKSALPNIKGRDLFDASIWADPLRTSVFYTFATTLRQKVRDVEPTESHHFIGHLRNRGKLVRCYTQNIDQIEEKVGLSTSLQEGPGHRGRFSRKSVGAVPAPTAPANPPASGDSSLASSDSAEDSKESSKPEGVKGSQGCEAAPGPPESQSQRRDRKSNGVECVFLHGSLESLRCFLCGKICPWDEQGRAHETLSGRQPECPYCAGATAARQERGKRALGVGKLRPDIVLYGEEHPNAHLISPIVTHDLGLSPDLLLILGTSLKVHGLKVLVREFAKTIHSRGGKVVFVNFTKPPESSWGDIIDYWVQWDCDAWVSNLKERIPLLWLPPGTKLPKKKKEGSERPKKRQSNVDDKTKKETAKLCDSAASSVSPEAMVGSGNQDNSEQPAKLEKPGKTEKVEKPGKPETPQKPTQCAQPQPEPVLVPEPVSAPEPVSVPEPTSVPELMPEPVLEPKVEAEATQKVASDAVKTEPAPKEPAKRKPKPTKETPPKPPPQRPMAVRDDKMNAAWLSWRVLTELRRITGSLVTPSSSPAPRITKSKPKRPRKSAPAVVSQPPRPAQPAQPAQLGSNENPQEEALQWAPPVHPSDMAADMAQEKAKTEHTESEGAVVADVPMSGTEENSILAAVKLNPRKRKRKTIDGEEVRLPGMSRSAVVAKTLPRPTPPKVKTPQAKDKPVIVSPKILSDIQQVSMTSLKLPPLRMDQAPDATPSKPPPLEPIHNPMGPLSEISTNTQSRAKPEKHTPFFFFDALLYQLWHAPNWTSSNTLGPMPKNMHQSTRKDAEAEAAMALGALKKGRG